VYRKLRLLVVIFGTSWPISYGVIDRRMDICCESEGRSNTRLQGKSRLDEHVIRFLLALNFNSAGSMLIRRVVYFQFTCIFVKRWLKLYKIILNVQRNYENWTYHLGQESSNINPRRGLSIAREKSPTCFPVANRFQFVQHHPFLQKRQDPRDRPG
jgi:hypothetical protein